MNKTRHIIQTLRAAGLKAWLPGIHEGVCLSPYCVVQHLSGSLLCPSGGFVRYRVHMYVPADRPEEMDRLSLSVREAIRPLETEGLLTLAQPCGSLTVNDTYRAAYSYIDYVSYYSEM